MTQTSALPGGDVGLATTLSSRSGKTMRLLRVTDRGVRIGQIVQSIRSVVLAWNAVAIGWCLMFPNLAWAQRGVFARKVRVQAATKIDWLYPLMGTSPLEPPADLLPRYRVKTQTYDFYGPAQRNTRPAALILFISPGGVPHEWRHFEPLCRQRGVIFAGVRGAGNNQTAATRVRATLEVLGDVRRRYRIDPERTYIAGFSGGATIAGKLAFELPEYFGGVLAIGQRIRLPRDRWQVDQIASRLSVASLCGSNEMIGPDVEHLQQREFAAYGIHSHAFVTRGGAHRMPKAALIDAAVLWMEKQVRSRRDAAKQAPATQALGIRSRQEAANAWLLEARRRIAAEELAIAVPILEGIGQRWPDLASAQVATDLLDELNAGERTWEAEWRLQQDRVAQAQAEGYEKLAFDRRSWFTKERRANYAKQAVQRFQRLDWDAKNKAERLDALQEILDSATPDPVVKLSSLRFQFVGSLSRDELVQQLRQLLERLEYQVQVGELPGVNATSDIDETPGVDELGDDRAADLRVRFGATPVDLEQLKSKYLKPLGLRLRHRGNQVWIEAAQSKVDK